MSMHILTTPTQLNISGKCMLEDTHSTLFSVDVESMMWNATWWNTVCMLGSSGGQIPLVIMTSDDTHYKTQELLETNKYFGMLPDQIQLLKQVCSLGFPWAKLISFLLRDGIWMHEISLFYVLYSSLGARDWGPQLQNVENWKHV